MQYSITAAISTILFASTLTSAVAIPRAADATCNVQFKTGDGDTAEQQTFTLGSLQTTAVGGTAILSAVNAEVVDEGVTCQAFSDAKGQTKLATPFTSTTPAIFNSNSDGSTASVASDAVAIKGMCCAATAQFNKDCGNLGKGSSGNNSGKSSSGSAFPVTIQIDGLDELATQGDILADGVAHKLEAPLIGKGAISASIVHTHAAVYCQAFDKNARKLGGYFAVGKEAVFSSKAVPTVDIATVACSPV